MSLLRARLLLVALVLVACESRLCRDPNVRRGPTLARSTVWTPPVYTAPRIATPPMIDGKLDDAVWQQVPWTPYFQRSNAPVPGTQHTRAKLAWDDNFLYAAFEVEDNDILTRDPKTGLAYEKDDDPLYMSEVVEVFLDADGDQKTYNEIEVSPLNKLFDASFERYRQMNLAWASGVQHAVVVDGTVNQAGDVDHRWTAELAIPFKNLMNVPHVPPQQGDRWRFNLYRLDHDSRGGEEGQAFSWVSRPDFHDLARFGVLVMGGPAGR